MITVDYYKENRVVVRIGDENMVLDSGKSEKRREAQVVAEKNGLEWRKIFKKESLTVGDLIDYVFTLPLDDYSQAFCSGSHVSRLIFNSLKKGITVT